MITVYITTSGAKIFKEGDVLKVKKDGATYHTIFPFRTEQVVAFGGVEMTYRAMNVLLRNGINTVFLNKNGHYNGKLVCPYDHNVLLRHMQYKMLDDEKKCLNFCRAIAYGKIRNQFIMLQRISRFQKKNLKRAQNEIKQILSQVNEASNIKSLRGYEGSAAKVYFGVFDEGFINSQGFTKRVRRPPTDPVNAVLSLLYTVLSSRVDGAVEKEGLDPYVGIFHAIGYGRRSLSLDLMEEFRTIIVDTLVFSLFNMNIIGPDDFRKVHPEDDDYVECGPPQQSNTPDILKDRMGGFGGSRGDIFDDDEPTQGPKTSLEYDGHTETKMKLPVLLTPIALRKVIAQFERKLETEFTNPIDNKKITYREAITNQVKLYIAFLRGEREDYSSLVMK